MFEIIKIIYIYEDHREVEKQLYLSCGTREQLEALRKLLKKNRNCNEVFFTYEEH